MPVFAPYSMQEAVDIIYEAPALADKWRTPVMILVDGMMGQMMEPVALPEMKKPLEPKDIPSQKPWAITGYGAKADGSRAVVKSLRLQPEDLEAHIDRLFERYGELAPAIKRAESINVKGADIVFVAYGITARLTMEVMEMLAEQRIKAGLIRPISLWPFPYEEFDKIGDSTKVVISAELSMGQLMDDVEKAVKGRLPVKLINRTGGSIPTSLEIFERAKATLEGLK